ncbi:MAG: hypothetical protein ACI9W4_002407 [Rhodothermales bacterium]|jgi:hypothetical protein
MTPVSEQEAFKRAQAGLKLKELLEAWKDEVEAPLTGLDREGRLYRHYSRYNWDRMGRLEAVYAPSEALIESLTSAPGPLTWLVITENWCADAAYSLPVVRAAAEAHGNSDLRFLLRDTNLDVMDRYLTGGSRSIPIVVVFSASGQELLRWGAKPKALADHLGLLKADGADGRAISAATIAWYEDEGWLEIERELKGELASLELA